MWDITESTATVMAACIPALRVLVRKDLRLYETPKLREIMQDITKTPETPGSKNTSTSSQKLQWKTDNEYEMEEANKRSLAYVA